MWSVPLVFAFVVPASANDDPELRFPRAAQQEILRGDPEPKPRPCLCQFGIGLRTGVPGYQLEQLIDPDDLGHHSYGIPSSEEHNGQIYTCRAGFVDTTHLRAGVDWTAHLVVLLDGLTHDGGVVDFSEEGGGVRLVVRPASETLSREDLFRLAQRVAYERLVWHEVMSWYYHAPVRLYSEQQSTFSPEDTVSDFLGTEVARRAIERVESLGVAYEEAVDTAIDDRLAELGAVDRVEDTRANFHAVDRNEVGAASWYDSSVIFWNQGYLLKREVQVLNRIPAWRVPSGAEVGCGQPTRAYVARVPRTTERGTPLTELYEWQFTPERRWFRTDEDKPGSPRYGHEPLPELVTNRTLPAAVEQVAAELRAELGPGFDQP